MSHPFVMLGAMTSSEEHLPYAVYTSQQDGLVTTRQLRACGATKKDIEWLVVDGHLERDRRGVLRLPGLPSSVWRDLRSALLAIPGGVAVGRSAGGLHGLPGIQPGAVEVAVRRAQAPRREGVLGHSAPLLEPADIDVISDMPCTTIYRTVCDLAPGAHVRLLERMIDHVERIDRAHGPQRISEAADRIGLKRRPGLATLMAVLAHRFPGSAGDCDRTAEILRWLLEAGLPLPVQQHPVSWGAMDFMCDAAYPDARIDIEVDDDWSHATPGGSQRDKRRDQLARRAGWEVVRVTPATTKIELLEHLQWALNRASLTESARGA